MLSSKSRALLFCFGVMLAGCYSLNVDSGHLKCSVAGNQCPNNFHCAVDGFCWKDGQDPPAAGLGGHKGMATVAGAVTAHSEHYKIVMSTAQGNSTTRAQ
jgi:hypothetical protein